MKMIDPLKISRASSVLQQEIAQYGRKLRLGRDFTKFKNAISKLEDRNISNQFNLEFETLLPLESFWLMCRDEAGAMIAGVAVKREDIGGLTAPEYWSLALPRIYRDQAEKPIELKPRQSRAAMRMSGVLAYVGDAYASPKYRKTGLAPAMGKLAMLSALQMWPDLDYCYAFIHNEGMTKALATNHGFSHQHPMPIRWKGRNNPSSLPRNMWLALNSADDVLDLIDQLN